MILADMLATDADAVACDLAETYNIYDYKQLPPTRIAAFCVGLRNDSRIKMKMAGTEYGLDTMLLASVADRLSMLLWINTDDGVKGRNRPKMILDQMIGEIENRDFIVFDSAEDFEKERNRIIRQEGTNGT